MTQNKELIFTKYILENSFESCLRTPDDSKDYKKAEYDIDISFLTAISDQCYILCNELNKRVKKITSKKGIHYLFKFL